jgi:hypothetical protein
MAQLVEIVIDCLNPARLAKFWADALSDYHVRIRDEHGAYTVMLDPEGNEFCVQDEADN